MLGLIPALLVTTPDVSAIRDADRVIGLLAAQGIDPLLIINRVDREMIRRGDMLSPQDVIDILGIEQVGLVLRDETVVVSANTGEPVVYNPRSKAGKAFIQVAERLLGTELPIDEMGMGLSLWAKLGRKMRRAA